MNTLKLTVENLARIRRAEVEIKPLTIFFGKNNTNKSYMAHVVYGFYKYLPYAVIQEVARKRGLKEWTAEPIQEIFEKTIETLERKISQSFRGSKGINLRIVRDERLLSYVKEYFAQMVENLHRHLMPQYGEGPKEKSFLFLIPSLIFHVLKELKVRREFYAYDIIYFPASRTGFVLAFDALITGIIKERYALDRPYEKLTEPVVDFLLTFNEIKSFSESLRGKGRENKLLEMLGEMIGGEIWIDEKTKQLYYHPKGARGKKKIEMHLVSSSVAEIAPIYVVLANSENLSGKFFIIEEPEAHLHPENQIRMAELIVEMVKMGAKVLITTHSDYLLNALNICIQRFWAAMEDKANINPDMVSAYIFREDGGSIEVSPLPVEEEGISFENFYSVAEFLTEAEEEVRHLLERRKKEGV